MLTVVSDLFIFLKKGPSFSPQRLFKATNASCTISERRMEESRKDVMRMLTFTRCWISSRGDFKCQAENNGYKV